MKPMNPAWPPSGRYAVAVSGGADSMVLLHLLAAASSQRGYELIVAHFDHGIRADSAADALFVAAAAARYHLTFECASAKLQNASEASARAARHAWLDHTRAHHQAAAILTAHHQDDLLETSLLNLARGTGRRGLAPMQTSLPDQAGILRPLLALTRRQLREYAEHHRVAWREDSTNADLANPRNLLRLRLLAQSDPAWCAQYYALMTELAALNVSIDQSLVHILAAARRPDGAYAFPRDEFRAHSPALACEIIAAAARSMRPGIQLDAPLLEAAGVLALTGQTGKQRPLRGGLVVEISRNTISLLTKPPL